jgi:hypothetical protein
MAMKIKIPQSVRDAVSGGASEPPEPVGPAAQPTAPAEPPAPPLWSEPAPATQAPVAAPAGAPAATSNCQMLWMRR